MQMRIFEPRYLSLIKQCQENDTGFGVVAIKSGTEVRSKSSSTALELHSIGTLASLKEVTQLSPEMLGISVNGNAKFCIESHWERDDHVECALVRFLASEPETLIDIEKERDAVQAYFEIEKVDEEERSQTQELSLSIVTNRLADAIPFPLHIKQKLLEIEDPTSRLEAIKSILS